MFFFWRVLLWQCHRATVQVLDVMPVPKLDPGEAIPAAMKSVFGLVRSPQSRSTLALWAPAVNKERGVQLAKVRCAAL